MPKVWNLRVAAPGGMAMVKEPSKNKLEDAAKAVFCRGVRVVHRRILVS
jgi:hypothetical protein